MNKKKVENSPVEGIVDGTEFVELKRDMQSAKVIAWLEYNQQQLIAGAVVIVLMLVGISLWKERELAHKEAAALMYIKAINNTNAEEKAALLDSVIKTYPDTGYATLAGLQQNSSANVDKRKEALKMLIATQGAPEFSWQARLDLASLYMAEGESDKVSELLESHMGKHFEQARYALLAEASLTPDEKIVFLQKAVDAETHDKDLTANLEAQLALLKAAK
ncbi:MAG: tetratricopeptide repeat protein [Ghiorsea sp.]